MSRILFLAELRSSKCRYQASTTRLRTARRFESTNKICRDDRFFYLFCKSPPAPGSSRRYYTAVASMIPKTVLPTNVMGLAVCFILYSEGAGCLVSCRVLFSAHPRSGNPYPLISKSGNRFWNTCATLITAPQSTTVVALGTGLHNNHRLRTRRVRHQDSL